MIASRTIARALNPSPIYFTVSRTLPGIQQLWLCQLLRSGIARSLRGYKRYSFHGRALLRRTPLQLTQHPATPSV